MKDTPTSDGLQQGEAAPARYLSFILRCQARIGGGVRARLLEVHSGFACSLDDLDELPDIVRRRVAQEWEDPEGSDRAGPK